MFKKQKIQEKVPEYDDTRIQERLRIIERALKLKLPASHYWPIISYDESPPRIELLKEDNHKLKLELKALEWRIRKLEA